MGLQDADANDAGFGARIRSAIFWRSGSQILSQAMSWVVTLAVIRLLDPADYGLFAMTQVILNFATFLNGYGLVSALVQSDSVDSHRLRQAFGIMLLLNGGLAILQLLIAPLAADYYEQPMVADLLRVQALLYLSTPFLSIPEAIMGRALDFRRPALVNLIAAIASAAVALAGAMAGWGVWTLVFAPIAGFWVKAVGYVIATGFRPIPSFDFRGTGGMVAYGASLLGGQLFWIVQSQADIFIGGRVLEPHALGLYAEALFLTQIFVSKFIPPLNDVAFPAYARMQKDPGRVAWSFCKAVRLLLLISCPVYLGMAVTAEPLVETLFGRKWIDMAPFVAILALAMPFMTLQVMFAPVSNALGRPGTTARIAAVGAVLMPAAFLIGIRFGAIGLAWAWLGAFPLLTVVTARLAGAPMGLRIMDVIRAAAPGLGCSILMAGAVMAIDSALPPLPAPVRLAVLVPAGGLAFLAALALCARGTLMELAALLIRRAPPAQAAA
ncbi:lipopolysaccharide biosynthesis protein [Sphingobium ummariense]|uniref:Capsule biosynthesis protein CapK n=1 Tax=Sphingobium ummariense RL-3 TaxID=1346791 RepID=T0K9E4_9SPHN|nr:lipopolysaccharide biosynthesis protein [Sphingobium ummariense]EQB33289.1 capsule biosynthesis protein CapK [Sphingobium ummariense RL-3]